MTKPVAVQGCELQIQPPYSGNTSVTSMPSMKGKIQNKGIFSGGLSVFLSNVAGPGLVNGAGAFSFLPSSQKMKIDQGFVHLEGESADASVTGQTTSVPPAPITVPVTVKINGAGQSVLKAA
jgi:hypothetical protein